MTHIRRISVHVDEPEAGYFSWVLMEEGDDLSSWVEIADSDDTFNLWLDAFNAGCEALIGMVADSRVGPRRLGEDEDESPVGTDPFS